MFVASGNRAIRGIVVALRNYGKTVFCEENAKKTQLLKLYENVGKRVWVMG